MIEVQSPMELNISSSVRVSAAIRRYWHENGFPPTLRDICKLAGIRSTSHVAYVLKKLQHGGLISRTERIARSIKLTEAGEAALDKWARMCCDVARGWRHAAADPSGDESD